MAFGSGITYPGYGNPYTNPYAMQMGYNPAQQNDTSIIWVKGEAGANAFPVQNGKSVVLFDSEEERFFIKTVDISGMPQPLRIFNYSENKPSNKNENPEKEDMSKYVTRDDLNVILSKYDEMFEKINSVKQPVYPRKDNRNGKPVVQ